MKILAFNWNNILTDVITGLEKRGHTILPNDGKESTFNKAEVIVVWNETTLGGWHEVVERAKKAGKKTVLVQHGRRGTSRIYPPFNEELISDVVCVWGEADRQRLLSVGVPDDRIVITGTPVIKCLIPRIPHKGKNVVFSPEHWDRDVTENFIVADELKKLKGVTLFTKVLTGQQEESMYPNPIASNRNAPDHLGIVARTLAMADVVVAISESTFELLAEILDIPVVIADVWIPKACDGDDRYKTYHREYSEACTMAKLHELNKMVMQELKEPERLKAERFEVSVADGGIDITNPIERIIKVIEQK